MKRFSDEIIARYHDGELSDKAARKTGEALSGSPEDQAALDKISRLGDMVRLMAEVQTEEVSFDGFDKRVLNQVKADHRPGLFERAKVWWSEFLSHRKFVWIPTASLAGAAVAVLLALPIVGANPVAPQPQLPQNQGLWMAAAMENLPQRGSEVTVISNDPSAGVSYSLRNDRGETVGVAWIND